MYTIIDNKILIIKGAVQINRMTVWTGSEEARLSGDLFHLQDMEKRPTLESECGAT
jgi:hypothetical protein